MEEGGYYLRLVCNKGAGVAVSLYKALESFTGFSVRNSNLATISERFVLSFTLNVILSSPSSVFMHFLFFSSNLVITLFLF